MHMGCQKMGCGRSKHEQSQKNSSQEEINTPQKTGRKKKLKGEKKENKVPKKDSNIQHYEKNNPVHTQNLHNNSHVSKPPVLSVNGSQSQDLHIDIDLPAHKEKENRFLMPTKDGKPDITYTSSKNIKVTHSQIEFFKMLDEKIEKGGGYDSEERETDTSSPCD